MSTSPREITIHHVPGSHNELVLHALGEPGKGGENQAYLVTGFTGQNLGFDFASPVTGPEENGDPPRKASQSLLINFQSGPIPEVGVNGLTNEVLLAIVRDRLEHLQGGQFPCEENEKALVCVTDALDHLKRRTRDRMARQVEGQYAS